jgi:hypothetical protein
MLPEMQADLKGELDMGCSFSPARKGAWTGCRTWPGNPRPIYNYMGAAGAEASRPPFAGEARRKTHYASFDAGRGCPYQCSFCTIINVQGRKSRGRTADDVEKTVREHVAENIRNFFITDDNFARNKDWESIFDRLIELRERDGLNIRFMIQVDTLCHKIPNFIEKARRAGVNRAFIGLENINPANLLAAKKRQNKITEYRKMLLAWKRAGVITYGGYILGFAADTPESIRADIEIIKRELPIDFLEFFILTPLPGSEDHKVLWQKGVPMDADMNQYDSEHAVTDHSRMSRQSWEDIYREAWRAYYTPEHMVTILRRGAATNSPISGLSSHLLFFANFVPVENIHPLQGGLLRRKYRRDRRPGFPIENIWSFYPNYAWDSCKIFSLLRKWIDLEWAMQRIRKDPNKHHYTDQALTDVTDDETESLELFTHTDDARHAVEHARKVAHLTSTHTNEVADSAA